MSDPIIPAPRVPPSTDPKVTLHFNYKGSSYAPRPDTLSSMKTFAKKNAFWLLLGTVTLSLLYALYSFITRKPSTPPDDSERRRGGGGGGGLSRSETDAPLPSVGPEVIIGKGFDANWVAGQFKVIWTMLNVDSIQPTLFIQATTALLNRIDASESFKIRIRDEHNVDAFRELVEALLPRIAPGGTPVIEMPVEAYTKNEASGEYYIVEKFAAKVTK